MRDEWLRGLHGYARLSRWHPQPFVVFRDCVTKCRATQIAQGYAADVCHTFRRRALVRREPHWYRHPRPLATIRLASWLVIEALPVRRHKERRALLKLHDCRQWNKHLSIAPDAAQPPFCDLVIDKGSTHTESLPDLRHSKQWIRQGLHRSVPALTR